MDNDKLQRRQQALNKLEETKRRIAREKGLGGSSSSQPVMGQHEHKAVASSVRDATNVPKKSNLFSKPYIEFNLSTIKDTRGGFLSEENHKAEEEDIHAKWLNSLQDLQPPFSFDDPRAPKCYECGTKELDFRLWHVFKTRVCRECRLKMPEKYSLLTKTECRQDYLLTDPELRDEEKMPHLERPNPYQNTYSNMMLYLRYQVEEFALAKWGSFEALDAEFEKRTKQRKTRKQARFESRLRDMRNRTRAQAITGKSRQAHSHQWDEGTSQPDGTILSTCVDCGMTRTELKV